MAGGVGGLDEVLANLNREIEAIEDRGLDGLYKAGLFIQAESQREVPVDTGNLRGSAYTRRDPGGALSVEVGYTAAYAPFVHEAEVKHRGRPRQHGTRKGTSWEVGKPKFLEDPLRREHARILEIIAAEAAIDE